MKYIAKAKICHNNVDVKIGEVFEAEQDEIKNLIKGNLVELVQEKSEEEPKEKKGKK